MSKEPRRPARAGSPSVVFGAANYWGGPIVTGSQHYARCFARAGWRTAYLSDQISPLHLLRWKSRMYTRDKFRLWLRGGVRDEDGRLFAYNHLTLLPIFDAPLLRSRWVLDHSLDLSVPRLDRLLEREGVAEPDLLWIDHLVFAGLRDRLRAGATVYRMADDPTLFPEAYPAPLLERVDRLVRESDLVVVTSERLRERVASLRSDGVLYLPNGVDYAHFARESSPPPPEYRRIPGPRLVYAGSIEAWFDADLLAEAARSRPDWSYVVIGPVRVPIDPLRALPNVHVLGQRPYEVLPDYFAHAQVGLIPFRRSPQVDAVHPIKLYEYLAAGLPVVATRWDELERLGAPCRLAGTAAELVDGIEAALAEPAAQAEARRAYARGQSWQSRFERVVAELGLEARCAGC